METQKIEVQGSEVETTESPKKQRILIVEDDVTFEPIWQSIIGKANRFAALDWATSVQEAEVLIAEAQLSGNPHQLVISDIFLSGSRTGIDLWQQYRSLFHERFILVSAAGQMKMLKSIRGQGEPIYLQKPLVISEAITTVYGLLHRAGK